MEITEDQVKLITDSIEKAKSERNVFFKTVIDFLKWTTTFTFAAIVWVTSNFNNPEAMKIFLALSLLFLIFSVIASIITVYSIVLDYGRNWDVHAVISCIILEKYATKMEKEQKKEIKPDIEPSWYWRILPMAPQQFNLAILIHLSLLLIGLILYAVAIIF